MDGTAAVAMLQSSYMPQVPQSYLNHFKDFKTRYTVTIMKNALIQIIKFTGYGQKKVTLKLSLKSISLL